MMIIMLYHWSLLLFLIHVTFPAEFITILSKTVIPVDDIVCVKSPEPICENIIEFPDPANIFGIAPYCYNLSKSTFPFSIKGKNFIIISITKKYLN